MAPTNISHAYIERSRAIAIKKMDVLIRTHIEHINKWSGDRRLWFLSYPAHCMPTSHLKDSEEAIEEYIVRGTCLRVRALRIMPMAIVDCILCSRT